MDTVSRNMVTHSSTEILIEVPPFWHGFWDEVMLPMAEWVLLFAAFGLLMRLFGNCKVTTPFGPTSVSVWLQLGLMLSVGQWALWVLASILCGGTWLLLKWWALWLTPPRAIASGLFTGAALWWLAR
jgi:hypothetical protein